MSSDESKGLIVVSASDYVSSSDSPSVASDSMSDSDYVSGSASGSYLSIAVHSSSVHGISDIVTAYDFVIHKGGNYTVGLIVLFSDAATNCLYDGYSGRPLRLSSNAATFRRLVTVHI